jgi:class 3 adenylate cyclase
MDMDPAATGAEPRETRILAAIVFTDVVGFSRLAAQNESRVYVALQRDMGVITNLCRAHTGQVLNTMGDGMLLCFMSAVDAMTCAMEIQRTLFNQARSLPAADVLQHRIGVHLGDVIMSGDNVFGDGVNVAARLQAAAKPGGICFSHTVHDVIKNKLKLDAAISAGNQQLKNLGAPVKVWHVPPLEEARRPVNLDDLPAPVDTANAGASGFKGLVMVIASLVLVGVVIGVFMSVKMPKSAMPAPKPKPAKADQAPPPETTTTTGGAPSTPTVSPAAIQAEIARLRAAFDFAGILAVLDKAGKDAPAEESAKRTDYERLAALMAYLNSQVDLANAAAPLRFEATMNGSATTLEITGPSTAMQARSSNGQSGPVSWGDLGIANVAAAARTVSETNLRRTESAPPEIKQWIELLEQQQP